MQPEHPHCWTITDIHRLTLFRGGRFSARRLADLDRAARRQIPHPYCGQPLSFVMVASMPPACTPGIRFAIDGFHGVRGGGSQHVPAFDSSGRWIVARPHSLTLLDPTEWRGSV